MRDTDRDRVTHLLVRRGSGIASLADLRGKTIATGAKDSPQATLLPLHLLVQHGLEPGRDTNVRRFDVLVGKHGDHVGGELEALRSLIGGESDAAAVLDLNWEAWRADGTADPNELTVLATTAPFDHRNFTVLALAVRTADRPLDVGPLHDGLRDPAHRRMMDMEGLKAWLPGRTSGYAPLEAATRELSYFEGAFV